MIFTKFITDTSYALAWRGLLFSWETIQL